MLAMRTSCTLYNLPRVCMGREGKKNKCFSFSCSINGWFASRTRSRSYASELLPGQSKSCGARTHAHATPLSNKKFVFPSIRQLAYDHQEKTTINFMAQRSIVAWKCITTLLVVVVVVSGMLMATQAQSSSTYAVLERYFSNSRCDEETRSAIPFLPYWGECWIVYQNPIGALMWTGSNATGVFECSFRNRLPPTNSCDPSLHAGCTFVPFDVCIQDPLRGFYSAKWRKVEPMATDGEQPETVRQYTVKTYKDAVDCSAGHPGREAEQFDPAAARGHAARRQYFEVTGAPGTSLADAPCLENYFGGVAVLRWRSVSNSSSAVHVRVSNISPVHPPEACAELPRLGNVTLSGDCVTGINHPGFAPDSYVRIEPLIENNHAMALKGLGIMARRVLLVTMAVMSLF